MNIQNVTPKLLNNNYPQFKSISPKNTDNTDNEIKNYDNVNYSQIAFGAIYNVKTVKKINIDAEKNKLLKQITELLEVDSADTDITDIIAKAFRSAVGAVRTKFEKQTKILKELEDLYDNKILNPQQKSDRAQILRKEFNRLDKFKTTQQTKPPKAQDERIDYQLLNKFKTAISEDNFNLHNVIKEYYKDLNDITSIEELNKKYPKIKTPKRPEDVIAKKIESTLTRDFYENLNDYIEEKSDEKVINFLRKTVRNISDEIAQKSGVEKEQFYKKIAPSTHTAIIKKFLKIRTESGFSSVPEQRKVKTPQITDTDIKLLSVNFDDFVISTIKKHYLNSAKLNEITYTDGKTSISITSIKDSDYKFEKLPEKIKKIVNESSALHAAQRDYENFDFNQFKTRLNFYANSELGNNEQILKSIIDFDACNFTEEDKSILVKFLKELDAVNDGEKTLTEGIETILFQDLKPKGTLKLNELEREKTEQNLKIIQKQIFKMNELKTNFDNAINVLYMNNLNNIANTCSKYRPSSLEPKEVEKAKFIIETITKNIKPGNEKLLNKNKLEQNITRWDTYNYYSNNIETNSEIYKKALSFAAEPDGKINIDKAGQYLVNYEITNMYPESLNFAKEPDILKKIMEKTSGNTDEAIKYLCKFDKYLDLDTQDQAYLSKFVDLFDQKDSVEKTILRYIIENDYINTDTTNLTNLHDAGSETIAVTIGKKAKQQIMDKYKYPRCIYYLKSFEDALSSFANEKGSSGIKRTGRNNETQKYKMELKIAGENDRLFSSNNDYYFDIFSDKGMH